MDAPVITSKSVYVYDFFYMYLADGTKLDYSHDTFTVICRLKTGAYTFVECGLKPGKKRHVTLTPKQASLKRFYIFAGKFATAKEMY